MPLGVSASPGEGISGMAPSFIVQNFAEKVQKHSCSRLSFSEIHSIKKKIRHN
jgi:hypothetical protein